MKKNITSILLGLALTLAHYASAQNSAFTQGKLTDGSAPANGSYDMFFLLYDAPTSGTFMLAFGRAIKLHPYYRGLRSRSREPTSSSPGLRGPAPMRSKPHLP